MLRLLLCCSALLLELLQPPAASSGATGAPRTARPCWGPLSGPERAHLHHAQRRHLAGLRRARRLVRGGEQRRRRQLARVVGGEREASRRATIVWLSRSSSVGLRGRAPPARRPSSFSPDASTACSSRIVVTAIPGARASCAGAREVAEVAGHRLEQEAEDEAHDQDRREHLDQREARARSPAHS